MLPDPVSQLLAAIPSVTGPFTLVAFLSVIFYLVYRRSVHTKSGLFYAYDLLRSLFPRLSQSGFFLILLLSLVLILIVVLLVFLRVLSLDPTAQLIYMLMSIILVAVFVYFAQRVASSEMALVARENGEVVQMQLSEDGGVASTTQSDAEISSVRRSLQERRKLLQQSLLRLEETKARYGMNPPVSVMSEIDYIEEEIRKIDRELANQ